jgi:multiple sugar transport system permease protein
MRAAGRLVAMLAIGLYCLAPLLWQLVTSLKPAGQLATLPPLLPHRVELASYRAILGDTSLLHAIANSLIVAGATTLLALALGAAAGFALAKLRVARRAAILAAVVAVSMFPPIATVSPLFLLINAAGLRDTLLALILTYTTFSLPLAIWLMTNFFRGIPDELYLAARVDGCTPLRAFYRVLLPLAAPGLAAAALLVFIFSWNEFLFALSFTATERARTVPVAIALFPGIHEVPWGDIAAASVVVTLPLIVLAMLFHRRIVEGLTAGSVKG